MEGNGTVGQQVGPVAFTDVGTLESREMSELGRVIMPINDSECFSHHPKMSSQLPSNFRAHEGFPYLQCDICTAFPCIRKIRVSCSARNCYSACSRTEVKCMALQQSCVHVLIGCIFSKSGVLLVISTALICSPSHSIPICLSSLQHSLSSLSTGRIPGHSKLLPLGQLPKIHKEQINVPDLLQTQTAKKPFHNS